jgi:succinate dehydrogenase/fumarate reductase cytochrome b subunit
MILAHSTIPLIIFALSPTRVNLFAILLGGYIPSLDILPTLLRKETPKDVFSEFHTSSILHTPFLFLILSPVLFYLFGSVVAFSFTLGGVLHILIESFDERGRMLLYPFNKKFYGIRVIPYDFWDYLSNKGIFIFEALLVVIACTLSALPI